VSGDQRRAEVLEALVANEHVFVEPMARAYARIRQLTPDVVVIYAEIDDEAACQLLSILKMDPGLSSVRVVMYTIPVVTHTGGAAPNASVTCIEPFEVSMTITLTDDEVSTLQGLLQDRLPALEFEVARTDAKDVRHILVKRQELCERLLNELNEALERRLVN